MTSELDKIRETAERVGEALGAIVEEAPQTTDRRALRDLNARCLRGFAEAGLLDLAFLDGALAPGDVRKAVFIVEGLASRSGTVSSIFMVNVFFGGASVVLMGTDAQKAEILPALREGRCQLAFAMTEPGAGSDANAIATRAEAVEGGFVLTGEKLYTTGAYTADWILVVAKARADTPRGEAVGVFLVPPDAPGVSVEPLEKLAGNAQPSCRVVLGGVRIPADRLLGGADGLTSAWTSLRLTGALERLLVAATCSGSAARIADEAAEFAKGRVQFGRPIAEFQAIQHALVDMRATARIMRLLVRDATEAVESGADAAEAVCTAKYWCSEQLQRLVIDGMRVFGGRAYFLDSLMARVYLEAPLALYAGGTVEIQKNLIARAMGLAGRR